MTKITIKYDNGNEDYFITESNDDNYIFMLLNEIANTYPNIIEYKIEKQQKVKKR